MQQYTDLMRRIINEGEWIDNARTGKKCKVVINVDLEYSTLPIVTTRKSYFKSAVAEIVGYLRGYDSAKEFRDLGTKTWDMNANDNEVWLNNSYRKGTDDMGRVYGVQGRGWRQPEYYMQNDKGAVVDQLKKIYDDLKAGKDDRGEILSFYNPGEFHMGCLRPCIYDHQFSLLKGTLYLHSKQRSCDVPLGLNFNMVQCYFLLQLMAKITGHKAGIVYHKIVNAHCYEDQYELMKEEASREPIDCNPVMAINSRIKTLEDVENIFTTDDVTMEGYESHSAIKYPFST